MITGAHSILYSKDAEADRNFFKKVLKFPAVDVGDGWLIFGLPPSELAIHPDKQSGLQEFYLICSNIESFIAEMKVHKIRCSKIYIQPWGKLIRITLPGGGKLGVYEALHSRPKKNIPVKKSKRKIKP